MVCAEMMLAIAELQSHAVPLVVWSSACRLHYWLTGLSLQSDGFGYNSVRDDYCRIDYLLQFSSLGLWTNRLLSEWSPLSFKAIQETLMLDL
jgi:hypothetical protein